MVRIRGGSVSARRTFKLRDEEDEDIQVVEPSIKSSKKKTGNRGGKTKQFARKKQNAQTREPSVEPSDEQMEEYQSEGHPVSGNEEELEQPTNVDVTTTKSPKKGKKTAKRKSIAQPKGRQTADPSGEQQDAEKNAEEQQTDEPSTRKSPRTRSGIQDTAPTTLLNGKRKRPEHEQSETQTAVEPSPLPKFIDDEARERFEWISQKGFIIQRTIIPYEFRKLDLEPDKGKTPAIEEETEEDDDDDDEDTEEEDPAQFHLAR
nr:nucleolin-like [Coffea arabica]